MKKVLFILLSVLILAACSDSFVKDEKFVFSEEEFKKAYEEANDKNLPTNVGYDPELIRIQYADKNEAIDFLNATAELLASDEIRRLKESIDNEEENIPNDINGDGFSVANFEENDSYDIYIRPFEFKE